MSEPTQWDGAAKQRVKETLIARVEAQLEASREAIADERSAAELPEVAVESVDDLSQSDEAGDLHGLFEGAAEHQAALLAQIEALDVSPKQTVEPGAIVAFDGDHYLVGVVAEEFDCDGVTVEGISTDSPVYAAAQGLGAGDSFTLNGHTHRIDLLA